MPHARLVVGTLLLALVTGSLAPRSLAAQSAEDPTSAPASSSGSGTTSGRLKLPWQGGPLVTGVNVMAGSAFLVRTASNNESFDDGAFRMVSVQFSRSLFQHMGIRYSWIVEAVPAIMTRTSAPSNRRPSPWSNSQAYFDARRYARYTTHDAFGVGLAPLGAEAARSLSSKLSAVFTVTAGGAIFSSVVPYGKATQANFTVAPALSLEWRVTPGYAVATGYALHHLSNASFGAANPGLNSHLLVVRLARARQLLSRE